MTATDPPVRPDIDALLASLYDAVMAPSGFQVFIETLCDVFECKSVLLCIRQTETHEMKGLWLHGMAQEWLESIFSKTGTKRQTDLVSMLLASPAYFLARDRDDCIA